MKDRHAYLIMTHGNFEILKLQLEMLDDSRNDIYIHVDKKVKNFDFLLIISILFWIKTGRSALHSLPPCHLIFS